MSWKLIPENFGLPLVVRTLNDVFRQNPPGEAGPAVVSTTPPASSTATGTAGDLAVDATYLYVCVATNSWKRLTLASF